MRERAFTVLAVLRLSGVAIVVSLALGGPASATGFFINQQSVKGLGRVGAGNSAAADDLGTIFFNPAGLTEIWHDKEHRMQGSIGAQLIIPRNDIRNTGSTAAAPGTLGASVPYAGRDESNPTNPTPVPNLYWAKSLAQGRAAVGAAINSPFGLATSFSNDWFGRYDSIEASLRTINLSVVGAYRFDSGLSIGGGLDAQYAKTRLVTAIPNPLTPGGPTAATDGRIETSGHDWTPGFNVGLLYPLTDKTRVGAHYRSAMKHNISGSTEISGLTGPLAAFNGTVGARADLNLPAIGSVGIRHKVTDDLSLLADFEWYDWSKFREVRIRFDDGRPDGVRTANYRDAYAAAVGAEYRVSDTLSARGGIRFDKTPTVDDFRDTTVPDSDRLWLGVGATYRMSRKSSLDFAFNHVFFRHTNIALTRSFFDGTPLATSVGVNGAVKSVVNTISIDFRCAF